MKHVPTLSGIVVECLEIIDVESNLKQFDSLTGLTLTPYFTTDLCHWPLDIFPKRGNTSSSETGINVDTGEGFRKTRPHKMEWMER